NKFDRRGAEDALRDVRKQWKRNRTAFDMTDEDVPVYPTIASQFNDPGVTWMFVNLCRLLREKLPGLGTRDSGLGKAGDNEDSTKKEPSPSRGGQGGDGFSPNCDFNPDLDTTLREPRATVLIPGKRVRYLAEIA